MSRSRWFVDIDGNLVWPLDKDPEAIYLNAAVFEVNHDAPAREAREAFAALRSSVEHLEAMEEICQRVADGWHTDGNSWLRDDWSGGGSTVEQEPLSPEVAAVLWPETTDG